MSRCGMCGGTGRTEPTALDRLDLAETGVMDLQCLACDGTGWVPVTTMPGWAQAQADLVRADQLRRHQAALNAELAYQTGVAAELVAGEVEQ